MKILITGGAGYIGSTLASLLEDNGHTPIILDSLITGKKEFTKNRIFFKGDICDKNLLKKIFSKHSDIKYTIHCAALIVVPESVTEPYKYYHENVCKSLEFFKHLIDFKKTKIIFSSSAAIYAPAKKFKVTEKSPLSANCPYAMTKIMIEKILQDFCNVYPLQCVSLRYFNPIGADPKFRTGPYLKNPSHLLGKLIDTATGKLKKFPLTGTTWPTRDGSGVRDYVHVWDLAQAHLLALKHFDKVVSTDNYSKNYNVINLGTEHGVTVKEFIKTFENVCGKKIKISEAPARPGDVAGGYASCKKALKLFGWHPQKTLEEGIKDAFAWDKKRASILGY